MVFLHIVLDSPAKFEVTKTELDNGMVTEPYVAIAHCIRAGLCVSHALRSWVRVSIGFDQFGPLILTLDPTTIRFLGTDERSILYIILRGQRALWDRKMKVPHGIKLTEESVSELLQRLLIDDYKLLLPGRQSTWRKHLSADQRLLMYCPLFDGWGQDSLSANPHQTFSQRTRYDLSILEVVHAIDTAEIVSQKD
ncbi:MAG: hypothetical protein Q6361_03060 [Candidatus Hermodarchaeota archaeon]|nr:hypothetical protein [Candidatus Hermodarchaeota archaeon]